MGEREEMLSILNRVGALEGGHAVLTAGHQSLLSGQAAIRSEIAATEARLKQNLEEKHTQNRNDIHNFRDDMQSYSQHSYVQLKDLGDSFMGALKELKSDVKENTKNITNVRLKLAGLSLGSGALTAIGIKVIDHFWGH